MLACCWLDSFCTFPSLRCTDSSKCRRLYSSHNCILITSSLTLLDIVDDHTCLFEWWPVLWWHCYALTQPRQARCCLPRSQSMSELSVSLRSIHHCVASHFLTLRTGSTAMAAMNPLMLKTQRLSSLHHTDTSIHLPGASQFYMYRNRLRKQELRQTLFQPQARCCLWERGRVVSLQLWTLPSNLQGIITESKCATQLPARFDPHSSASAVITDVIMGKPL